mgnify:CR=1 FL=1
MANIVAQTRQGYALDVSLTHVQLGLAKFDRGNKSVREYAHTKRMFESVMRCAGKDEMRHA